MELNKDEYGGWTIDNSRQRLNRFCMAERISCDFENNVVQTNNGYGTHFLLILIQFFSKGSSHP